MEYNYKIEATAEDFKKALSTPGLLNDIELKQLAIHYNCEDHKVTFTELARLLGENSYQGVSSRNVWMAKKISRFLNINPPDTDDGSKGWWAFLHIASKKGRYWQIELKPEVVSAIDELHLFEKSTTDFPYPEEINNEGLDLEKLKEGAVKIIYVNAYAREGKARAKCITHFARENDGKILCNICKFDFEKTYGNHGKGFIHVHHRTPISEMESEYEINPITDLLPVCPNCHAMLHRGSKVLSPKELQEILRENSPQWIGDTKP
jgi:5-methylcytosine-specific restriction protein A